jgi:hypothetical protein
MVLCLPKHVSLGAADTQALLAQRENIHTLLERLKALTERQDAWLLVERFRTLFERKAHLGSIEMTAFTAYNDEDSNTPFLHRNSRARDVYSDTHGQRIPYRSDDGQDIDLELEAIFDMYGQHPYLNLLFSDDTVLIERDGLEVWLEENFAACYGPLLWATDSASFLQARLDAHADKARTSVKHTTRL